MNGGRSIPLGRVLGIPVSMSWAVVAVSVVGGWILAVRALPALSKGLGLAWRIGLSMGAVVCFLLSILAHEFGHALAARANGISTNSIRLWIFGGVATLSGSAQSPKAEFQIAIAGPAVNAVLGGGFFLGAWVANELSLSSALPLVLSGLGLLNVLLTVTNLVPAAPLDGGRVLSSIIWARTGRPEWARLVTARLGLVAGALVVTYGFWELLRWDRFTGVYTAAVGSFILLAARSDVIVASIRSRLARTQVADVLWAHPPAIHDSLSLTDLERHMGTNSASLPVERWANETIGYLATSAVAAVPVHERAWTSVSQLMTPSEQVATAWTSESLLSALERHGAEPAQMLGLDPRTGRVVGTATPAQFSHLLHRPKIWGGTD